jgi:hypothetical protein
MKARIAEAYHNGSIAGANHYFSLRRDATLPLPKGPYAGAIWEESEEWNRGFINGFHQGRAGHSYFHHLTSRGGD